MTSSEKLTELTIDDLDNIDITLMTLRKPTELKKVIDSVPKPVRAVPKNGLPLWYKLGLECKLPVPKMPVGKVIFSRGRIGEDVRRLGLGLGGGPRPTFDLTDPYCNNVSYDYVPMHDPHLAHHFSQKPARNRMKQLGFCTKDGRAVCSLKEFNQYRKYLYNQFMDRIHMEMKKLDERARDDLTLKRVENDVARRLQVFTKAEKAREHLEKVAQEHADEWASKKRAKAEIYAYNTDLELQRIRLANWKLGHGGTAKTVRLIKKMGSEFEKSKRGAKGMSPELAQKMAAQAMSNAMSTQGDTLMILGQARVRMDIETLLPLAPIRLLDEMLESAIMEFSRRRVHQLLQDVENMVQSRASVVFFQDFRQPVGKKRSKQSRWQSQIAAEMARHHARESMLGFGEAIKIPAEVESEIELKSIKERIPTPVPSKTKLAEVTFIDRVEDLPDPVSVPTYLPERKKLLDMVNASAKLLSRTVTAKVDKGMDVTVGKVTLPKMRHPLEWGEAVEGLAMAVVDNRVHAECADVRRACEFLTNRVLKNLQNDMKQERKRRRERELQDEKREDFYVPGE
ncbi:hypothetical protein B5X24_HaOG212781 [Helicoverpa armigera]|nr:hypothetical protein B5X24_HaOG212781 [Helicoverpa armigera]